MHRGGGVLISMKWPGIDVRGGVWLDRSGDNDEQWREEERERKREEEGDDMIRRGVELGEEIRREGVEKRMYGEGER